MQFLGGHRGPVISLQFSPVTGELISVSKSGDTIIHDLAGTPRVLRRDDVAAQWAGFLPDGRTILGTASTLIEETGDSLPGLTTPIPAPVAAVATLDPQTLAIGFGSRVKTIPGEFLLYDLVRGTCRVPRFTEAAGVRSITVHSPTRTAAWSNGSRRITIWDVTKPDQVQLSLMHSCPSLAFHPDGRWLAAAVDYNIRIFDLGTRRERLILPGHKGQVTTIVAMLDGRTLASGSWDETVRFWDWETGTETAVYRWPTGKVMSLAASPEGTRLAAGGMNGNIVVWDTE